MNKPDYEKMWIELKGLIENKREFYGFIGYSDSDPLKVSKGLAYEDIIDLMKEIELKFKNN